MRIPSTRQSYSVTKSKTKMATQEFEIELGVECNRRFRWDKGDKVSNQIRCLGNYKSQMEFDNKDFNADKVKQYESIRVSLAKIYWVQICN